MRIYKGTFVGPHFKWQISHLRDMDVAANMMRIWLAELDTQAYRFSHSNRRSNIAPVYPLLRTPINLTRSAAAWCLPGGMGRAAARGDREQKDWLHTMTGDGEATIGAAATLVSGAACHPALDD
jgi:hypothetical protein